MGTVQHFTQIQSQPGDMIFIPGMDMQYLRSEGFRAEQEFFARLRAQHRQGVIICSVCTGALLLIRLAF